MGNGELEQFVKDMSSEGTTIHNMLTGIYGSNVLFRDTVPHDVKLIIIRIMTDLYELEDKANRLTGLEVDKHRPEDYHRAAIRLRGMIPHEKVHDSELY